MNRPESDINDALNALADTEERDELLEVWDLAARGVPSETMDEERAAMVRDTLMAAASERSPESRGALAPAPRKRSRVKHLQGGGRVRFLSRRPATWAAAAVALILVGCAALWGWMPQRFEAPRDTIATIHLRDGSSVVLAPGTRLTAWARLGASRDVELQGEAWFEVAHVEGEAPFTVLAGEAMVQVLGTRFSVRAWEGTATSVYLEEGSVQLGVGSAVREIMVPGEARQVVGRAIVEAPSYTADKALSWLSGDFVFFAEPLRAVVDEVGRRFGVRVRVPEAWAEREVSGAFRGRTSAENVVRDLAIYLGMQYRTTSEGFELISGD